MIRREAWYRELLAESERQDRGFKPTLRRPGQSLEDWYQEQEEGYAKYEKHRRHHLKYVRKVPLPPTEKEMEEQEIEDLVRKQELEYQRTWRKERGTPLHQQRMQEDPEYAQSYRERMERVHERSRPKEKELHKKRMQEDPAYAEEFRKKRQQYKGENPDQFREYEDENTRKKRERRNSDPEYAEKIREYKREQRRRKKLREQGEEA